MQMKQPTTMSFAKNIISSTTNFIDKTLDFNLNFDDNNLKQMPAEQIEIFAQQSFSNGYNVLITFTNNQKITGQITKKINDRKFILTNKSSNLLQILDLEMVKSINLI
ncbi:hypothetical protein [Companilactobacillus metriopterae]|uniref:hypothetical protein n=1 Tax=Companilactobacillus metriopterae TaxID=1909267 RepID=UPI00100C08F0|nr:hypothetical protein [Companilactobacillus metriopterae]